MSKPDPSDQIWKRAEIDSPCIKTCVIEQKTRLCIGCLRTIDEITAWSRMTAEVRAEVMADLPGRKGLVTKRRGGRAGRVE